MSTIMDNNCLNYKKGIKDSLKQIWWTFAIKWNHIIRNYSNIFCLYFTDTFRAKKYTIIDCCSTSKFFGYSRNRFPFSLTECLATSCTPRPQLISPVTLPIRSKTYNSISKIHNDLPPINNWRIDRAGDYSYYINNKWTGVSINKITRLSVWKDEKLIKIIHLKHPSFGISHYIEHENESIRGIRDLVEAPTLERAKEIAEWYYKEWLEVNHKS